MPKRSRTHLLLIPSYNTGKKLAETVRGALAVWSPVWVVVDGSTDGSDKVLDELVDEFPEDLRVLRLPVNSGKGSAVLHGVEEALPLGYTHVLTMDADGQHSPGHVTAMMDASEANPDAVILGLPQFDASAPIIRLRGRKIANWWARLETQSDLGDCLFGFRVYPAAPLQAVMRQTIWARRFDFDPEVAMRLIWRGHPPVNVPAPCRYFTAAEGGVSHFNYYRDNVLLTWMFTRLFFGGLLRLPWLLQRRLHDKGQRMLPRAPLAILLMAASMIIMLSGCGSTTVSLDYQPALGQNIPGPRVITVGRFADMRRESPYYLGEVRTPIGTPLERINSRVPVDEVVRNAYSHGLSSRGMLASSGGPFVMTGEILDLHGDQVVRPAGYARIRVNIVRSSTGQIVFSRIYSGERESNVYRPGSGSPVPMIRELISRALQDAVDRALDDRSMRERLNPAETSYGTYRPNVF